MEYPIEIKGKTIKQVRKLNLSGKNLKFIPDNVYQYTNLEKLDLSKNRIEIIPKEILKLRKLRPWTWHLIKSRICKVQYFNCLSLEF